MRPLLFILSGVLVFSLFTNYAEGPQSGITGSPGDKQTCKQSGCHLDAVQQNATTSWITSDVPPKGFVKDSTYTITITTKAPSHVVYGFCAASQNKTGAAQGTLIITDKTNTQYADMGATNTYVTHTYTGSRGANKVWQFNWKAPSTILDSTTIYACVMAANGNGAETGDSLFLSSLKLTRAALTPTNDITTQIKVQVSPNPASVSAQTAQLSFSKPTLSVWTVRVYTVYGAFVSSQKVESSGDVSVFLSLYNLRTGLYAYSVNDEMDLVRASGKLMVSE